MLLRASSFLLVLWASSCSSTTLPPSHHGSYSGGLLLGEGTYLEEVTLAPWKGGELRFQAIFQRLPGGTLTSAHAGDGRKLFQVRDTYGSHPEPELVFGAGTEAEDRALFSEFYRGFRPLLLLRDDPRLPQPLVGERYDDGRPRALSAVSTLRLQLDEFDWEGHAFRLTLWSPGWTAKITLREHRVE